MLLFPPADLIPYPFMEIVKSDLSDDFDTLSKGQRNLFLHKPSSASDLNQRNTLLRRTSRDGEEVTPVGLCETAVPLGEIRCDRQRGSVQLINEEPVASRKAFGQGVTSSARSTAFW